MTLAEAQDLRAAWLAAYRAVATGQSYRIGNRQLTRADAELCRRELHYWDGEVERLTAGRRAGGRVMRVVPRDV